jgi:uncharacterized repeat protein (TIGR01451 family)
VTTTTEESNTSNNRASASIVLVAPDLIVTKVADVNPVLAGNNVTYTVTVTNQGNAEAKNVALTDILPYGLVFVSASVGCNNSIATVSCGLGTIAVSANKSVTITARTTGASSSVSNTVSVSTPDFEISTENNNSTATITVFSADLSLMFGGPPPATITPDSPMSYLLLLDNSGNVPADNTVVTDTLPPGMDFISTDRGCSFDSASRVVTCPLGSFSPGGLAITINVFVRATGGTLTNTAMASTTTPESNVTNNSAIAVTNVVP